MVIEEGYNALYRFELKCLLAKNTHEGVRGVGFQYQVRYFSLTL